MAPAPGRVAKMQGSAFSSLVYCCLLARAAATHAPYVEQIASGTCPTDYHASSKDPDWVYSPYGKCLRDATVTWGKRPWAGCKEVCSNGIYVSCADPIPVY